MKIYLDNAAATPLDPKVENTISNCEKRVFGNASSLHSSGREAKRVIDDSRKSITRVLNASSEEIIFTGSGTESDNLAILGVARPHRLIAQHLAGEARANKKFGPNHANKRDGQAGHIITTKIEHPAVLNACRQLEKEGFGVTYLGVGQDGIVNLEDLKKSLRRDTILISIMYANSEIGTIQPIKKISKIIKNFRGQKKLPVFHSDACQAGGALNLNVQQLGVDLMTLNGSKIYGPKGTGCLFIRRGVNVEPIMFGGSQERGLRPGTEQVCLVAGFAKALAWADQKKDKDNKRLTKLRNYTINKILKDVPNSCLNGDSKERLPNNINISFEGVDGEMLVLMLDRKGIEVSTGSACTTTSTKPSHVLKALGLSDDLAKGNIRITLGRATTKTDLDYFLKVLTKTVQHTRKINI